MEGGQIFETTKGIKGAKIQTTLIYKVFQGKMEYTYYDL